MNTAHESMDDMGDWAVSHPITRRAYIPQGCTQQGRHEATIEPKPPVDRVREEYDEDQTESADGVFFIYILTMVAVIGAAVLAVMS